jgi:hypothetical protein
MVTSFKYVYPRVTNLFVAHVVACFHCFRALINTT